MRVIFDLFRDGLTAINTAANDLAIARHQVATGRRLQGAGDDPLAAEQGIREHATLSAIDAYTRTRDSASSRLAAADSILNHAVDSITAAIVAGGGARGSHVSAEARAAASAQVRSLRDTLVGDFNSKVNGGYLFSGTATGSQTYAQIAGVWTYQGNSDTTDVEIEAGHVVSTSFDGARIVQGGDTTDLFTALDGLATAIDAGDNDAIGARLAELDRAFDRVLQAQGRLGVDERGVDEAGTRLSALRLAAESRRSKLEDANMAEALTRMSAADNAYRAALGAVSSAERVSLLDYLR